MATIAARVGFEIQVERVGIHQPFTYRARLGDIEVGAGKREDIPEQMRRALIGAITGSYEPIILTFTDSDGIPTTFLGHRDAVRGWIYNVYRDGRRGGFQPCGDDRDICERRMRQHAAQNAYVPGAGAGSSPLITNEEDQYEFHSWALWQDGYAKASNEDGTRSSEELRLLADRYREKILQEEARARIAARGGRAP